MDNTEHIEEDNTWGFAKKFSFATKILAIIVLYAGMSLKIFTALDFDIDDVIKIAFTTAAMGSPIDISIIFSNIKPLLRRG